MDNLLKNNVLKDMISEMKLNKTELLQINSLDCKNFEGNDRAMYERLVINEQKFEAMIKSLEDLIKYDDPVGRTLYEYVNPEGLKVYNRTSAFGTIFIIYESRPDVTIEAAGTAFKAGNKIILKGGKESKSSNIVLVNCWHNALKKNGLGAEHVRYLDLSREETQNYLKNPDTKIDLIVPRGGDKLIQFVREHATCPVLVSGRGNNFLFIDQQADWSKSIDVILNAKTQKIGVCNALDKILIHKDLPSLESKLNELVATLIKHDVEILIDKNFAKICQPIFTTLITDENIWHEEFLALKILIEVVDSPQISWEMINKYSGGHSAVIMTQNDNTAKEWMENVDCAAVYQNASTRFTDGGAMGMGAELAISTEKLHHRGPLGLDHLVTNKWYVYGNGHVRN